MDANKIAKLAKDLSRPGHKSVAIASALGIHSDQIPNLIAREIRNGNLLGLSQEELTNLSKNLGDESLSKVIAAKTGNKTSARKEDKTSRTSKQLADSLEALHKRLYDRVVKGKPKAKLVNGKKTKIPGFAYHFRKE